MKSHIQQARLYWSNLLQSTDTVIDATCGNGKDTAFLASLVPEGKVYALDIQEAALEKARTTATNPNIIFLLQSHETLPEVANVKLIVYNLGYLPGGDKSITTKAEITVQSIKKSLQLVAPGGAVTVTCYPGHPEGARETEAVISCLTEMGCGFYRHEERTGGPILFHIQK